MSTKNNKNQGLYFEDFIDIEKTGFYKKIAEKLGLNLKSFTKALRDDSINEAELNRAFSTLSGDLQKPMSNQEASGFKKALERKFDQVQKTGADLNTDA